MSGGAARSEASTSASRGSGRGGASERALGFFADLARGRATRAVARDLGVPEHYLRLAVGAKHKAANERRRRRLGTRLAIDEASLKKDFVYATVFSDPVRRVVVDVGPGRDGAVVWAFAGLYRAAEPKEVRAHPRRGTTPIDRRLPCCACGESMKAMPASITALIVGSTW